MSDNIEFTPYVRKPFSVVATKITEDNIAQLAQLVGEVRQKGEEKYIALDRRIVPNVGRAYVGWFVTRLGDNLRCYSPKVFNEQFVALEQETVDKGQVSFTIEELMTDETSAVVG